MQARTRSVSLLLSMPPAQGHDHLAARAVGLLVSWGSLKAISEDSLLLEEWL